MLAYGYGRAPGACASMGRWSRGEQAMRSTQRTQVLSAGCAIVALLLVAGPGRGEPLVGVKSHD